MEGPADKSFAFASDLTKQVITLSTGVIVLTISFGRDVTGDTSGAAHLLLALAWALYLLSIVFGVATLMALTGNLERREADQPSIYTKNIRAFAGAQIVFFLVAIALTIAFGIVAL